MSIEFKDVTVKTRSTITPILLRNINIRIEKPAHVALFAATGDGLDLIVDTLCAAGAPEAGRVVRHSSISWPLPGSPFVHKHQTFTANARFIARLYEMDQRSFIPKAIEMAGLEDLADERVDFCPSKLLSRFSFALAACLPFDFYLFTKTDVGGREDRDKYAEIIHEIGKRCGLIVATTNAKIAQPFCDKAFVIEPDGAVYYEDMEAATAHLDRLSEALGDNEMDQPLARDEDRVFDDFF